MAEIPKKRVARYIRVSTTEQRTGLQVDETAALIERRGWQLVETYEDHGISGSRDQRPALVRLLASGLAARYPDARHLRRAGPTEPLLRRLSGRGRQGDRHHQPARRCGVTSAGGVPHSRWES